MTTSQQSSRQAIDEFKAMYREEFGKTLSDSEVREVALRLLRFFGVLFPGPGKNDAAPLDDSHAPKLKG